jgi:4-amino-4-deoxy-L-arabinose transferase-like glycosyltransferase
MTTLIDEAAEKRGRFRSYLLVAVVTVLCLLPFSGKAFNIDDALFLFAARQITQHPFDPFGFEVNWYRAPQAMWTQTMNPPGACYALALAAEVVGWSERALHLEFALFAVVVTLGTYYLARRFTESPAIAVAATLLTPVFLVSANTVMCDMLMLALWMVALVLWMEGIDREERLLLTASVFVIGLCALTKYFGIALVGLLLAYTWVRKRRLGGWAWYFAIPILMIAAYQQWTWSLDYGHMFGGAVRFARGYRRDVHVSLLADGLVDLSFLGGCVLPGLIFAPVMWSRKRIAIGAAFSALAGFAIARGWLNLGQSGVAHYYQDHLLLVGAEAGFFIAGGLSILGLAIADVWRRRDADAVLLSAWVLGTFYFAGFVNWTNNGRSILPVVPAVGILLARRVEGMSLKPIGKALVIALLAISGAMALWVALGDAALANSAREAAMEIHEKAQGQPGTVWFEGHWGFQYYMQLYGAQAVDVDDPEFKSGDFLAIPGENGVFFEMRPRFALEDDVIQIGLRSHVATMQSKLGAAFYSSDEGPLPFVIGKIPAERYDLMKVSVPNDWASALVPPKPRVPLAPLRR